MCINNLQKKYQEFKKLHKYTRYCSGNTIMKSFVYSPTYPKGYSHEKYTQGSFGLWIPIFSDNEITELYLELYGNKTDPDGHKISEYYERLMKGEN